MIEARALTLAYGKKVIVTDAEFHIEKGRAAILVGDNGSGKSTLLSAMAGALKPKSGTLTVNGKVGYIPQGSGLMEELTFGDNLRFFAAMAGVDVPKELPFDAEKLLKTRVRQMSGGMKKLCSIVCAVIAQPDILLLDEPCASLDAAHKKMLIDYLCRVKSEGMTLVYVGHNSREYEAFADVYLCVDRGVTVMTRQEYTARAETAGDGI